MHSHVRLDVTNDQSTSVLLLQCRNMTTHTKCQEICNKRETLVMKEGLPSLLPRLRESEKPDMKVLLNSCDLCLKGSCMTFIDKFNTTLYSKINITKKSVE